MIFLLMSLALAMDPVPVERPALLSQELLEAAKPEDWRRIPQRNLLYMQLESGLVLIELSSAFAPKHVLNIKQLAENHFWDGQRVLRVQDNYVTQWGDESQNKKKLKNVLAKIPGEYRTTQIKKDLITPLNDKDVYTADVGFYSSFPVGYNNDQTWLLHCYGTVGVSRGEEIDSGNGQGLYAVIGHSPRHLDLNITLVGKVRHGMEHLSSLPRGQGPMGFYLKPETEMKIKSVRMGTQLPKKQQKAIEVLRTDTPLFKQLIGAKKFRQESWFHYRGGRVSVCNVPLPSRLVKLLKN